MITIIFRAIITIVLLVIVWQNTHWSVALCLTFASIEAEIVALSFKIILKNIEELKK